MYVKCTKCVQTCAQREPEIKDKAGPCGIHVFPHTTCGGHVLEALYIDCMYVFVVVDGMLGIWKSGCALSIPGMPLNTVCLPELVKYDLNHQCF